MVDPRPRAPAPLEPELAAWMREQRWFAGKGGTGRLTVLGSFTLPSADPDVTIETRLVLDADHDRPALYQVPLVRRRADHPDAIAAVDDAAVLDGPRDPAYAPALLDLLLGGGATGEDVRAEGTPLGWSGAAPVVRGARVLSGEQSNTSVIVDLEDAEGRPLPPAIMKVFRALHHGENPDVVLQSAIAAAGSDRVPETFGAVTGRWPDEGRGDGRATGHLAVAQEFLAGTEDAWRVALRSAEAGDDFRGPARALGEATAEVHRILADRLGTTEADGARRDGVLASMRTRAADAAVVVHDLAGRTADIDAGLQRAARSPWPAFQRIHGDLHLGQVLLVPERGWVLLDFEGEPLRPMAERSEPDVPLRDVAGMLRSFDYVAGTIAQQGGDAARAQAWAADAREAFLAGYEAELGAPLEPHRALLDVFELDKALYECVYEARNRPGWLPIPRDAVLRLLREAA